MELWIIYLDKQKIVLENGSSVTVGGPVNIKLSNVDSAIFVLKDKKTAEMICTDYGDGSYPLELMKAKENNLLNRKLTDSFPIVLLNDFDEYKLFRNTKEKMKFVNKYLYSFRIEGKEILLTKI